MSWMLRHLTLSARFTIALSGAALVLLGAVGVWQVTAEETDLRTAFERDLQLLGRSLQVAFENALRDRQGDDVEETLRALERIEPTVDVYVFDEGGRPIATSTGARPRSGPPATAPGRVVFHEDTATAQLLLPLQIAQDRPRALLVLERPLDEMRADLAATRWRVVLSVGGFVAVVVVLTMVLSHLWVGAPLARMIGHMKRVRAGDLSPTETAVRRDEVGATISEFETLVRELHDARQRLDAEGEARRQLELAVREMDRHATIGQLATGLAHEIGSPLQILDGRIGALVKKADDPSETRRLARVLREQTRRITRIVERLMSVARRPPIRPTALDPVAPLRAVVDLLEGEARRREVRITLTVDGPVPPVRGDSDSLQQIALNLLRNALDATAPGGHVAVRVAPSEIVHPDGVTSPAVRLTFRDDGQGMSEDTRRRAFEPFFTTRTPRGTGLGLAVVKRIVDEHQGRIGLTSEAGVGTTFVVDLPCHVEGTERDELEA